MSNDGLKHGTRGGYALIISGGSIDDTFAQSYLKDAFSAGEKPFLIAADRGLLFLNSHSIVPDLLVGDFDSVPEGYTDTYLKEHPGCEARAYSWEKDYTDTEIAVTAACDRGCRLIDIIGGTGTRLDHVLGNIQELALILEKGREGRLIDPHNRITLHDSPFSIKRKDQWGKYVSFFAWGGDVKGLTLEGFHFPAKDIELGSSGSLAVSNQISAEVASVSFTGGKLLMVESAD